MSAIKHLQKAPRSSSTRGFSTIRAFIYKRDDSMAMQHPVPAAFLEQIGDITVSFALLENMLQTLGGAFMKSDDAQIVLVELPFRSLRGVLYSLAKAHLGEGENLSKLASLLKRAGELEESRNQVTHSIWGAGDSSAVPTITRIKSTAKQKAGFKVLLEPWDIDQFRKLTCALLALVEDVQRFHRECLGVSMTREPGGIEAASTVPPLSA